MSGGEKYMKEYEKRCQYPYACPVRGGGYPKTCFNPYGKYISDNSFEGPEGGCRPFGYQPKLPNPGGLKFYFYNYPYQGFPPDRLTPPGLGWYEYEKTGRYYNWW
jgi:hypothetical protein